MTMELKQAEALLMELADGVDPLTGGVPTGRQRLQPAGDHPRAALRAAVCVGPAEAVCTTAQCGQAVDGGG